MVKGLEAADVEPSVARPIWAPDQPGVERIRSSPHRDLHLAAGKRPRLDFVIPLPELPALSPQPFELGWRQRTGSGVGSLPRPR